MQIDPSRFHLNNVTDTCAIWNLLSSRILYQAALTARCIFSCTKFVEYECLAKPRRSISNEDRSLQESLRQELSKGRFTSFSIELADLLEIEILPKRKNLGKGELSSIAFARKTRQAFMTDDQAARRFATDVLGSAFVQTTPHLFSWLVFTNHLSDTDKDPIIKQHSDMLRPLGVFFETAFMWALQCRLKSTGAQ